MIISRFQVLVVTATTLLGLLAACATTSQTKKKVETSGFLGDYSKLTFGGEDNAKLVYVNPAANFAGYDKILIDPIKLYASPDDSFLINVPEGELKSIVDYLDAAVREQLKNDYVFVNKAGPGTMRLRIALTEAKGANIAMSAASTVTPIGLALNGAKKAVTGKSTGVGKAGIEMEILDSQTPKRLAAAIDERAGTKVSSFGRWDGVQEACDYWAVRLKNRLAAFRRK